MWLTVINIGWAVSAVLALWMLYDWYKVDSTYSEDTLTSSREGEIEAVAEKHNL
jgi:multisubunit Na+/H+ antiporter MnhC subunit